MRVDDTLTVLGVDGTDVEDYLSDIVKNMSQEFMSHAETRYYEITPDTTEDGYTAVVFSDYLMNIFNGVVTKSDIPDIIITATVQPAVVAPCDIVHVPFAHHGSYVLVNNGDAPIYLKALVVPRVVSYLDNTFEIELKNLLLHAITRDANNLFLTLRKLSGMHQDLLSEAKHTMPPIIKSELSITPCQL
ncbi:MAG: hypothetical protein ACYC3W_12635 [Candidatus Nanopelagicales bacterium]